MGLINANDAVVLANRAVEPERLVAAFGIAEAIVREANKGKFHVIIDFHYDPRVRDFKNRKGLVEYLTRRGYDIESRGEDQMVIHWLPSYDHEENDGTK